MRSSSLVVVFVLAFLSLGRAHADPAVEVPFDPPPGDPVLKGKCVKWSNGLVGTTCSYCAGADDGSCGLFRTSLEDDFGSATHAQRGTAPTFGVCHAVGADQVCDLQVDNGSLRCRYSTTRAACYFVGTVDNRAAATWIMGGGRPTPTAPSSSPPSSPPPPAPSSDGPAVEVPATPSSASSYPQSCVKWSTGLVGTACSFCMDENDRSCRMCRDGFGSATCSIAKRGEAPTFGRCHAEGNDQVCEYGGEHCRYSADRAACYATAYDSNRDDVNWINSRQVTNEGTKRCIEQAGSLVGRACVVPAADGVHGQLCFYGAAMDSLVCTEVASPTEQPTFGTCTGPDDNRQCEIADIRCRYWGGPSPDTRCYAKNNAPADTTWIDDNQPRLGYKPHHFNEGGAEPPNILYVGIELGMAHPGAPDYFANGYGRAFMVGSHGFEMRLFEGYDLPDPKMMYKNVAGTSNAFVISSLAYRYVFAQRSRLSLSALIGLAVMHRSLFGTSGDQLPGFEDFPDVQQQFGVGAMVGAGVILFGFAYVDVRAYPSSWGGIGVGDNAAAPGGIPVTTNAGVRVGF